jgi:polyribonucleotide nucleotidyltransferase
MDAGVPILNPVAGISIGLVSECNRDGHITRYVLLTDILGIEDHYGDMDFKIAGTTNGITGFQLDLKIPGLPFAIAQEAVRRSKLARGNIARIMHSAIPHPRRELRTTAPRTQSILINAKKIGTLIGPSGKKIKRIMEQTETRIDIRDDDSGQVTIFAPSEKALHAAIREIELLCSDIEQGKIYHGIVRGIKEFGVFVECLPGKEGLVHISEFGEECQGNLEDICHLGDEVIVKCIRVDEKGRVCLSRKAALGEMRKDMHVSRKCKETDRKE